MASKFFNINWVEREKTIVGDSSLGSILIDKEKLCATVFGITGTRIFYPDSSKIFKNDNQRISNLLETLNGLHLARCKYITGAWLKS